ncbi:MAG: hypothetical protein Q8P60_09135, partial [Pseudorhodobacter sp.]|nr:hypothetical protein [Pseudorhodobacter sp.]
MFHDYLDAKEFQSCHKEAQEAQKRLFICLFSSCAFCAFLWLIILSKLRRLPPNSLWFRRRVYNRYDTRLFSASSSPGFASTWIAVVGLFLRSSERYREPERTPLAFAFLACPERSRRAFHPHPAAVLFHHVLDQRQSQSRAGRLASGGACHLEKLFEDLSLMLLR